MSSTNLLFKGKGLVILTVNMVTLRPLYKNINVIKIVGYGEHQGFNKLLRNITIIQDVLILSIELYTTYIQN